jgi:hypothetical protein
MVHYEADGVPDAEHILVIRANDSASLEQWLNGRVYIPLFLYESQGLEVYRVYAKQPETPSAEKTAPPPTLKPHRSARR